MNKVEIQEGGHRFRNGDFMHLQDAVAESFRGLVSGIRPEASYILFGMEFTEPTPGNYALSEGYMVFRGEVLYSPAQTFNADSTEKVIIIQQTVDGTKSPVLYEDGQNKNVHLIRRAQMKIIGSAEAEPKEPYMLLPRMHRDNTDLTLINGWVTGDNPVPTPFYRIESGRAYLCGDIKFTGGSIPLPNTHFYQFPANVKPDENQNFSVLTSDGLNLGYLTNPENTWIRVDSEGKCWADPNVGSSTSINLSGVSFNIKF